MKIIKENQPFTSYYHLWVLLFGFMGMLLLGVADLEAGTATNDRTGKNYKDLQTAINEAIEGDKLSLNGFFATTNGPFIIEEKTIALIGREKNPAILDGNLSNTVMVINGSANHEVTLKNLFITHGNTNLAGGGINNTGNLTLANVTVSNNKATFGGGIFSGSPGNLTISNSLISHNKAMKMTEDDLGIGGGIATQSNQTAIKRCEISNNTAAIDGGGIAVLGNVKFTLGNDSTISNNKALAGNGGGLLISVTNDARIRDNCTIRENQAFINGGGIYISSQSAVLLKESRVVRNTANTGTGGGIFITPDSTLTDKNSTVKNNTPNDIAP